ncbi:uncharacterized protein F5891DRAFT_940235 [Suillus fuscotomentosus]|uniref:Uncharacterized protein n=1 Tax=Suillus fuscotomentosus TaxID=1912939 RepID=A0AAD4EIX5_9AGAM|nr:uncharacterized protein F5891DRAFT_940235 [Suillus fuscotomentosus]KAG1907060.1 hypothetical protein F5891DRAFT_940235 [Suillus fuscotomentosus]
MQFLRQPYWQIPSGPSYVAGYFPEPLYNPRKNAYHVSVQLSPLPITVLPLSLKLSAPVLPLPAAEFSKLLQQLNIEGHTAPYWAIVNDRREALWAFMDFIPDPSLAFYSDLYLACMMVGDNTLFTQLELNEMFKSQYKSLRQFLGCPPDEVQIQELSSGRFVASFCVRMFQKRLRTADAIPIEYLARGMWSISLLFQVLIGTSYSLHAGRIWTLWVYLGSGRKWVATCQLEEPSLPVEGSNQLRIEAHRKSPDCATPKPLIITSEFSMISAPR